LFLNYNYRSNGEGNLKNLLAKMGVPLREARQSYTMMDVQLKRQLRAGLLKHAPAAGLQQIVYRSFVKRHGDKLDMSAADMVFSITSLLEGAGNTLPGVAVEDDEHVRERAFWRAYDALSRDNCDLLECGISEAQRLQVAIVKCGTQLLEKRAVVPIGPFRYVVLDQSADTPLFGHVAALTRLALFIMDAVCLSECSLCDAHVLIVLCRR
jgi:cell division control protein 45